MELRTVSRQRLAFMSVPFHLVRCGFLCVDMLLRIFLGVEVHLIKFDGVWALAFNMKQEMYC